MVSFLHLHRIKPQSDEHLPILAFPSTATSTMYLDSIRLLISPTTSREFLCLDGPPRQHCSSGVMKRLRRKEWYSVVGKRHTETLVGLDG